MDLHERANFTRTKARFDYQVGFISILRGKTTVALNTQQQHTPVPMFTVLRLQKFAFKMQQQQQKKTALVLLFTVLCSRSFVPVRGNKTLHICEE